ncbi:unnamed protein product [Rhizophagus irregularis]|uniref:C2 domain-containing protein n=1 Tax=Rhizophagus irregularis TaxID=588596 RepID=A0A2I1GDQ3_9GLOM|nr:hypothetical protein RhiirA4_443322 [Rhizophagus irregularis]CAB4429151.1 unnamed protein product [Rhizophagus irregularis]
MTEKGTLTVTVVEAKNLKNEGFTGDCELFVKLILDARNAQATTKKNDLNPTYNETFNFNIDGDKYIYVECWDKDDVIGTADLKLDKVFSSGYEEEWIKMEMETKGEVKLILDFIYISLSKSERPYKNLIRIQIT